MDTDNNIMAQTTQIVAAYAANNKDITAADLVQTLRDIFTTLQSLQQASGASGLPVQPPAVTIKKSVTPEYIVCLEDGKKLKMLKRHLRSVYKMSPDDYRRRWNLPTDYPMVAPNYAKQRSQLAKNIGLGTRAKRRRAAA